MWHNGFLLRQANKEDSQTISVLQLWVFQKNVRAISFHERHGFVRVRKTDGSETRNRSLTGCSSGANSIPLRG